MTDAGRDRTIDTSFDVRIDAQGGDPDSTSPTLRRCHQLLWSKPLPSGNGFPLVTARRGAYLYHDSPLGRFSLTSDTVVPTFRDYKRMARVIAAVPDDELDRFQFLNHTIGGMMVFPGDRRAGTPTINGARGITSQIADRFDLTVEALRRHYTGASSPLGATFAAYHDFFRLFGTFQGFVDYFLLHDLLDGDGAVRIFTPFDDFATTPALPQTMEAYRAYRDNAEAFLIARNRRIADWAATHLTTT